MTGRYLIGTLAALVGAITPVAALTPAHDAQASRSGNPPYLQCVPYARRVTGVNIYGDAHTWWGQASGRYARGGAPKVGAVMSFRANGSSRLGHVAAVSKLIDSRTVLISHANWSPINGRRGQIEKNVRAVDVSKRNDWSSVRVWYGPIKALGGRHWQLNGFIYNEKPGGQKLAKAKAHQDDSEPSGRARPAKARAISADRDPIGAIIARARR